jgi:hypothetical protein
VAKFLMKLAAANLRPGMAIARNVAGLTVRHSAPTRGSKRRTSNGLPGNRWSEPMRPVMVDFFSAADGRANVVGSWKGVICQVTFGTMEGDPEVYPNQHIFVASRAPWIEIGDNLPQNAEYPPDFDDT